MSQAVVQLRTSVFGEILVFFFLEMYEHIHILIEVE
jgi:hypothetical protein